MNKMVLQLRRHKDPFVAKDKPERHPMKDSPFLLYPLEEHAFAGEGNDYLCRRCQRPRALHRS